MLPRSLRFLILALVLPVALSGCSVFQKKKTPPPCPPIYILADTAKITKYKPGPGRDLTDVEIEAEIAGYKGDCFYTEDGGEVAFQISFTVKRGPAGKREGSELSYFVAIPKFFPAEGAKGVFTVPITFPEGVDVARTTDDEVVMRIPIKDREVVDDYEIYIGFQTTPEELEMNRRGK